MNRRWQCLGIAVVAAVVLVLPQGASLSESTTGDAGGALVVNTTQNAPNGACSPPPQCWRDRDCDPICGKRNGQCVQVNSCYRECACFS